MAIARQTQPPTLLIFVLHNCAPLTCLLVCPKFISPYGTKSAVASKPFVEQLQALDVDVVAYQDEVGCIRNSLPVEGSRRAFAALAQAHSHPGTPDLWANVESFTWQKEPNFDESALIPAAFPRILAQLEAVSSSVDRVISFTCEGIYQPPASKSAAPPWGPPAALREWSAYTSALRPAAPPTPRLQEKLLVASISGNAPHAAVGWAVTYGAAGSPDPAFAGGNLTDGLCGFQTPFDRKWVGFPLGQDAEIILTLPGSCSWPLHSVAASFLAVPPVFFTEGDHTKPVARNVTTWLPPEVHWSVAPELTGPWTAVGQAVKTDWWEREVYDIRTELYYQELSGTAGTDVVGIAPKYLKLAAKIVKPPWYEAWYKETVVGTPGGAGLHVGRLMVDELIVNFQ
eukprot:SAG22_NODE_43_length_25304_cov_5.394644_3_plen_399_part_00